MYLWLDLETTGLDPNKGEILEAAGYVTPDLEFDPYFGWDAAIQLSALHKPLPTTELMDLANGHVFRMHQNSGLWRDLDSVSSLGTGDLRKVVLNYLAREAERCGRKLILCGNSVHFDRSWLLHHIPEAGQYLSHRHVDVSSLLILHKAAKRTEIRVDNDNPHRAWEGVKASYATFHALRESWGV